MKKEIDIQLRLMGVATTIKGEEEKTILDIAIKNSVSTPYSCKGGACASCIGRIVSGEVAMEQNLILTDQEVIDGLVLSCQAIPTSQSVYIDFDDV